MFLSSGLRRIMTPLGLPLHRSLKTGKNCGAYHPISMVESRTYSKKHQADDHHWLYGHFIRILDG